MDADDSLFYRALDLQPGASPDEIRSAYRRLAKLYHPDKDPSLDGEMRYREIRTAYDALRQKRGERVELRRPHPSPTPPPTTKRQTGPSRGRRETFTTGANGHPGYKSTENKGWWYVKDDDVFDFSDLMWEYGGRKAPKTRVAFGWEALPRILWDSFKEVATLGMAMRWAITLWGLWSLFEAIRLSPLLAGVILFCTSIAALFFRYYDDSPIQVPTMKMLGSILYSLGIGVLCALSSHQMLITASVRDRWGIPRTEVIAAGDGAVFILVVFAAFFALLPLWVHPLIWLESGINRNRSSWPM
jgi:hypothetical protein